MPVKGVLNTKHGVVVPPHDITCTQCMKDKFDITANTFKNIFVLHKLAELESAVLPSQKVIHFRIPFRFEESIDEDQDHSEEAGHSHCSYHQPCKCGVL